MDENQIREADNTMLGKKMQDAVNEQINAELYSAYLYLSMSAYFESVKMPGMAHWMRLQTGEEQTHAMKLFAHVVERGGRVTLKAIGTPQAEWASPLAAFEGAYAHEQKVTGLINDLVKLAREEKDTTTDAFLQWFVKEQVEEEESADEIVQKLKKIEDAPDGLRALDGELGQRQ